MNQVRSPRSRSPTDALYPLESGDRLEREEFERRYEAMPKGRKAELIGGVVFLREPVRIEHHGRPSALLASWLGTYVRHTPGVDFCTDCTLRLGGEDEPQPDAAAFLGAGRGGTARVDGEGYLAGPPELILEVAASTASLDLHDKLDLYRKHGVQEYLVVRTLDRAVDWFDFANERAAHRGGDPAVESQRSSAETLHSTFFPGLSLDVEALFRNDIDALLRAVERGCDSAEHRVFVQRVQGRSRS